jgi:hypothetical protein
MNKYNNWYNQITINGKKSREPGLERHHIFPRSLGGTDDLSNITFITPREHFVCHWLLTKIYPNGEEHWKMLNALRMMRAENSNQKRYSTKITSRVYAKLKEKYSLLQSQKNKGKGNGMFGKSHTNEAKEKISKANQGDNNGSRTEEARKKISQSKKGKKRAPFTAEWKAKLSAASSGENNSRYGVEVSEETKQKISAKLRGRKQTDEEKARRGVANKGKVKPKKLCPHCRQQVAVNGYARWHGPRCRTLIG